MLRKVRSSKLKIRCGVFYGQPLPCADAFFLLVVVFVGVAFVVAEDVVVIGGGLGSYCRYSTYISAKLREFSSDLQSKIEEASLRTEENNPNVTCHSDALHACRTDLGIVFCAKDRVQGSGFGFTGL